MHLFLPCVVTKVAFFSVVRRRCPWRLNWRYFGRGKHSLSLLFSTLTQLASPALYSVTGPSNKTWKATRRTKYADYHLNPLINAQTTDITLPGILYFLVMFLLYAGAALVSSVGFVSTFFIWLEGVYATIWMAKSSNFFNAYHFSVLRAYAAPVFYAVLVIPHIMVCPIHPARRISVPTSEPLQACRLYASLTPG